jgi:predicted nucleic acid-binding protein
MWLTLSMWAASTVPGMRRAVLDSNAVDPLIDLPGAYETLRTAVDDGRLRLLFTHINIDELAVVSDVERRSRLLLAMVDLGQLVPTGACVADVSRLNFARLMEDVDAVEALRSGNIDHTRDALIAATAIFEKCALVTNDKRLAGRARERGIEVLTTSKLLADYGFAQAA